MPRTVTLTFDDGSRHTYQNVPDTVTPDQVEARAASEFAGRRLVGINGGKSAVDLIPTTQAPGVQAPAAVAPPAPPDDPTLGQRAVGAAETGLTMLTGATGGTLGMIGGTLKGLAEQILSGQFGTAQAANLVEQSAAQGAQALTYAPRTPEGQRQAGVVGEVMQAALPVMPLTGELAAIGRAASTAGAARAPVAVTARAGAEGTARDMAAAAVRPAEAVGIARPGAAVAAGEAAAGAAARTVDAAGNVAAKGAQRVAGLAKESTTLPRRALETLRRNEPDAPTPGTMGSAGAAGTDMATQRIATAEQLGFRGDAAMTKGQATRDAGQLTFENEASKQADLGRGLRERVAAQNDVGLRNMDTWFDQTGATAPTLREVGTIVDKALVEKAKRAKTEVNVKYRLAEKSAEADALVDPSLTVTFGEGDNAVTASPISYLNSKPAGLQTTALLDHARAFAKKLGIAEEVNGELVAKPATVRQMEAWRREISQATDFSNPTAGRDSTILKALIDHQTEPVAGPLFRDARAARARYAQEFEDRAVINSLLTNKTGTSDRRVAFEDVFHHAILKGSLDDVRTVRKVLQTSGPDGQQAWRELQGATVNYIRETATKSAAKDSRGNPVISAAALDKTIKSLDADGKLDFVFGKKGAQQWRDMADIIADLKTVPPESWINKSNTAVHVAAIVDALLMGGFGAPAPIASAARLAVGRLKDAALRRRINEALNNTPSRQAPGRRGSSMPQQAPASPRSDQTIH